MVETGGIYAVRPAVLSDLFAVMQVEKESFADGIMESEAVFAERLITAQGCNHVLVQAEDVAVCGYFTAEIWQAERQEEAAFRLGHSVRERHDSTGTVLYISSFALLPGFRGKKIRLADEAPGYSAGIQPVSAAKALFCTAIQNTLASFPQLERIILLVHEDWHKAIGIYESQGFSRTKILEHFADFGNKRAFIYEKPAVTTH